MAHYFEYDPNLKSEEKETIAVINDVKLKFVTDNGVFSKKGLDFGTRTLLETLKDIKGDVLDFGCGYGPIGIYVKKKYDCNVHMIDINERSLNLAKKNAELNNVSVNIYKSNIYKNVNEKFDFIITNPPIRVGKEILYSILFDAYDYLKENGKMYIVINKNQGAKSVLKDLNNKYEAEVIEKNKGFYVILAKKN